MSAPCLTCFGLLHRCEASPSAHEVSPCPETATYARINGNWRPFARRQQPRIAQPWGYSSAPGHCPNPAPPGNLVPTRIAQPWEYSSAPGHYPNPYLYPYPSSIRVESDRGDGRGHTTGERPHDRGEATRPGRGHAPDALLYGASRVKWDLLHEVGPLAPTVASSGEEGVSTRAHCPLPPHARPGPNPYPGPRGASHPP